MSPSPFPTCAMSGRTGPESSAADRAATPLGLAARCHPPLHHEIAVTGLAWASEQWAVPQLDHQRGIQRQQGESTTTTGREHNDNRERAQRQQGESTMTTHQTRAGRAQQIGGESTRAQRPPGGGRESTTAIGNGQHNDPQEGRESTRAQQQTRAGTDQGVNPHDQAPTTPGQPTILTA